jgi:hypothetical protein
MKADFLPIAAAQMTDADKCTHDRRVIVRIDCRAGGIQYRRYCLDCWRALEGAIAHAKARAELGDAEAPLADLEQLHRARDCYWRRRRREW